MKLIKKIEVYTPEPIGVKDVLIGGGKILKIADDLSNWSEDVQVLEGRDRMLLPGFIDQHVHITGGGGEGSFKTRVPEIQLSKLTTAGITTVVGLLGTDSTTRSLENLAAKAKALKEEGLSVYMLSGSYDYPPVCLTGDLKKDLCFIDEVVGCKVAISDHRAPNMTTDELKHLVADVRVGGMLSGKAGILTVHVGDSHEGLKPIFDVLKTTALPVKTMRPTHVNRNEVLLAQAFEYAKMGGLIDMTCGLEKNLRPALALEMAKDNGVPLENITMSSDGYGSWSKYDDNGNLIKIGVAEVDALYREFKYLVTTCHTPIEKALGYFTTHVAKGLQLFPQKGCLREGSDADALIVDKDLTIETVLCKGELSVYRKDVLLRGAYEA